MYYGLTDWLSEPTNGQNECCQCWALKCKKLTLLITVFSLTILFGIVVLMLWAKLGAQLPVGIMSVVVFLQFLCFLISVPSFFDETKYKMLMPLILIHCFAVGVYVILAIFYLILLVVGKNFGGNLRDPEQSVFLPGMPNSGLGIRNEINMTDNEYNLHILGHILFLLPIQLFLTWIAYGTYITFKNRTFQENKIDQNKTIFHQNHGKRRQPPHNVVVLEQYADDALYGSKNGLLNSFLYFPFFLMGIIIMLATVYIYTDDKYSKGWLAIWPVIVFLAIFIVEYLLVFLSLPAFNKYKFLFPFALFNSSSFLIYWLIMFSFVVIIFCCYGNDDDRCPSCSCD